MTMRSRRKQESTKSVLALLLREGVPSHGDQGDGCSRTVLVRYQQDWTSGVERGKWRISKKR
jgi:hypothetical protein